MNNYSWLQQMLHRIALSSSFMREISFDAEKILISNEKYFDNHVFISGLARSGTTILLNAIYESNEFASLSYNDMPFVLSPNLWSMLSFSKKDMEPVERAHNDGIKISRMSPEAFEEVFWMTFGEGNNVIEEKFKIYVGKINKRYQRKRYLSKNNQNIRRLGLISKIFPKSKILIPFRDPIQQAHSLLSQHNKFIELSKKDKFIHNYMEWIGHTEFGPSYIPIHNKNLIYKDHLDINHWIEQWYLTYSNCFQELNNKKNIYFISYEALCSSKEYWIKILRLLDLKQTNDFEFKESRKKITLQIENKIKSKALSLYSEINY